jgi:DNA-binding GntR family transcriptional regulator
MPNDDEINLYNKRYSGPCIKLESIVFDPEDKPIGVFDALFRGDKYRFKFASGEFLFRK